MSYFNDSINKLENIVSTDESLLYLYYPEDSLLFFKHIMQEFDKVESNDILTQYYDLEGLSQSQIVSRLLSELFTDLLSARLIINNYTVSESFAEIEILLLSQNSISLNFNFQLIDDRIIIKNVEHLSDYYKYKRDMFILYGDDY